MIIAIANGSDQIVDEILKYRDSYSLHDRDLEALQLAIDLGDLNTIKSLKKLKSLDLGDVDLSKVKSKKILNMIEEWEKQIKEERELNEQLFVASRDNDIQSVKNLLKAGADPNVRYTIRIPLIWASLYGHIDVVRELLANGADVHIKNDEALRDASKEGNVDVVRLLLAHDANIDSIVISEIKSKLTKGVKNRSITKKIADETLNELKLAKEKKQKIKKLTK